MPRAQTIFFSMTLSLKKTVWFTCHAHHCFNEQTWIAFNDYRSHLHVSLPHKQKSQLQGKSAVPA